MMELAYLTQPGDTLSTLTDRIFGPRYPHGSFRIPEDRKKKIQELRRLNPHLPLQIGKEENSLPSWQLMQMSGSLHSQIPHQNRTWEQSSHEARQFIGEYIQREGGLSLFTLAELSYQLELHSESSFWQKRNREDQSHTFSVARQIQGDLNQALQEIQAEWLEASSIQGSAVQSQSLSLDAAREAVKKQLTKAHQLLLRYLESVKYTKQGNLLTLQGINQIDDQELILLESPQGVEKLLRLGRNLKEKENGKVALQLLANQNTAGALGEIQLFYEIPNRDEGTLHCKIKAIPQDPVEVSQDSPTSFQSTSENKMSPSSSKLSQVGSLKSQSSSSQSKSKKEKPLISNEFQQSFDQSFAKDTSSSTIAFIDVFSDPFDNFG